MGVLNWGSLVLAAVCGLALFTWELDLDLAVETREPDSGSAVFLVTGVLVLLELWSISAFQLCSHCEILRV